WGWGVARGGGQRRGGRAGGGGVGRRGGGGGDVRVPAEVVGGVGGAHAVAVARARRKSRITETRARRRCDLRKRGAPGARAALHAVAGDADVVGRRAPGEIHLGRARSRRGQRTGRARRDGVENGRGRR